MSKALVSYLLRQKIEYSCLTGNNLVVFQIRFFLSSLFIMPNSKPMDIASLTNDYSLQKEKNKTASAKYRAKKNQQYNEMKVILTNLSKENKLLLHQLDHVHKENKKLEKELDRLHGQVMAQKMIK
ncbi:unnamed protein product [Rhizopus stolonifer]